MLKQIADNTNAASWASKMRRNRFALFLSILDELDHTPITVLDVGGTPQFWQMMETPASGRLQIVLLNLTPFDVSDLPHMESVVGDARDLSAFADDQFDIGFSNSVVEHVGTRADQQRMVNELIRVSRRHFIQTPNRYFPIEPHFLFPGFQFLPVAWRVWLVQRFKLGWYERIPDPERARAEVEAIQLLSQREFQQMAPQSKLYKERVFGLTKSFVLYR